MNGERPDAPWLFMKEGVVPVPDAFDVDVEKGFDAVEKGVEFIIVEGDPVLLVVPNPELF